MSRVEDIIGISERKLVVLPQKEREKLIKEKTNQRTGQTNLYFRNPKTKNDIKIGNFSTISINELDSFMNDELEIATKSSRKTNENVEITILTGVDIGQLQATMKTNQRCMVQIASNFNCLEVPTQYSNPQSGNLVENYSRDKTQGPAASFGPLSASLYRAHFSMPNYTPQTLDTHINTEQINQSQINLLEHLPSWFNVVNGKLLINSLDLKKIDNIIDFDALQFMELYKEVQIGLHTECPILYDRNGKITNTNTKEDLSEDKFSFEEVDQVLVSTINYNNYTNEDTGVIDNISEMLLQAAYEGTYLAAKMRKTKNLYLTLIGGGAFSNHIEYIIKAIKNTHNKYAYQCVDLENVYLCLYDSNESYLFKAIESELV